ncbi:CBO0543 family protein [Alicyclobacillus fastidiosus]|uniref:CBO0543 family protein n=1 Tax=Alicyclobacillus fastidiosus TaxID=392011 RepID=UPI0034DD47CC
MASETRRRLSATPAGNAIIINFYPYKRTWISKVGFVLATDAICSLYEALATRSTFFYYNGWRWWYSALAYLVIVPILVMNRNITRKLVERGQGG